jgi:hypothetical protein
MHAGPFFLSHWLPARDGGLDDRAQPRLHPLRPRSLSPLRGRAGTGCSPLTSVDVRFSGFAGGLVWNRRRSRARGDDAGNAGLRPARRRRATRSGPWSSSPAHPGHKDGVCIASVVGASKEACTTRRYRGYGLRTISSKKIDETGCCFLLVD